MTSIVTDILKKQMMQDLFDDTKDSDNRYFAAIGRSEIWNDSDIALTPENSLGDARDFRLSIQSIKNITDVSFVIPRYNWTSGTIYSAYDDEIDGYPTNAYYVINDNNQVYMCLQQGKSNANPPVTQTSTVQPTGNTDGVPFRTADGYMWKFLYSIGALTSSKFLSSGYLPITKITSTDSSSLAEEVEQETVQNNAVSGQVLGYSVTSGGSGYTTTPTVSIIGNGTDAKAQATVAGGSVVKVTVLDSSDSTIAFGSGYTQAEVSITGGGGSGAKARAIIGPPNGIGDDPRDDLKSGALMFNTKTDGVEGGDFIVDQDFRQLGLLRNPLYTDSSGVFTESTGNGLKRLQLTSIVDGPFVNDITIEGGTSSARGVIDHVDSDLVYYHQNDSTGYGTFDSGETISIAVGGGSTTATVDKVLKGEFDPLTGDLLYIDNRSAVTRSSTQTEDLKIVIQL